MAARVESGMRGCDAVRLTLSPEVVGSSEGSRWESVASVSTVDISRVAVVNKWINLLVSGSKLPSDRMSV